VAVDPEAIRALVAKYAALSERDRRSYKEAETRTNFIDLLFLALGWDVYDRGEVEREPMIRSGFADYAFKMGGAVRLYVEAKPLEDNLYKEEYARKAITYAYNKGVPWAVLCSFAGLQVFNAEWDTTDLNKARVVNLTWQDYPAADSPLLLLSRDAFSEGELEKHAQKWGGMTPRLPVEKSLFEQMRRWRGNLFSQVKAYRGDLSLQQVDEAVLRLLNRLIFIRSCEDRHIEETKLRTALNQWKEDGYQSQLVEVLRTIFNEFDVNYDSDLFNLALADQVFVESIALRDIIGGLYAPPRSLAAYDFSVMDADVLGRVYEQYLGYVAKEVKTEAAKQRNLGEMGFEIEPQEFEAKLLKRKAQGIYYTPKWVVDYIVKETVGRHLEEHSHHDILNMTILDPSCGSGSFLIDAFEMLLAHHARVEGKSARDLGKARRWQILTGNIFGVDLDQQAVDIARLNLLLRAVSKRELLPGLEDSVVRGNSLISGSREELRRYFGRRWQEKQAFDWGERFGHVMERGGFDVIVGNPPYVRIQTLDRQEVDYYSDRYEAATGNYDIYCLFVERGLQLLRPGGRLGFIVPNKFFNAAYGKGLRKLLSEAGAVERIVDFGDAQVFESGTNYTCLLFLKKEAGQQWVCASARDAVVSNPACPNLADLDRSVQLDPGRLSSAPWVMAGVDEGGIVQKLRQTGLPLAKVADRIFQGIRTSANQVYVFKGGRSVGEGLLEVVTSSGRTVTLDSAMTRPLLRGEDVKRYRSLAADMAVLVPYEIEETGAKLVDVSVLSERYHATWDYLVANRRTLEARERGKMKHDHWYAYVYPKNLEALAKSKIVTPDIACRAQFALDSRGEFAFISGYGITLGDGDGELQQYVLGLLNSRLLDFFLRRVSTRLRGGFYRYFAQFLGQMPIALPRGGHEAKLRTGIVGRVRSILDLGDKLAAKGADRDEERARVEREVGQADREIDALVYELYGLTQEERAIVEKEFEPRPASAGSTSGGLRRGRPRATGSLFEPIEEAPDRTAIPRVES